MKSTARTLATPPPDLARTGDAQQLAFGPVPAPKPRPTGAQLREAMTALHVHGTARALAFELLSYWQPGGMVFPSVRTLAGGLGVEPRTVRTHLARLERIGLWVRVCRKGRTNLYALRLPGPVATDTDGRDAAIASADPRIAEAGPRIVGSAPPRIVRSARSDQGSNQKAARPARAALLAAIAGRRHTGRTALNACASDGHGHAHALRNGTPTSGPTGAGCQATTKRHGARGRNHRR